MSFGFAIGDFLAVANTLWSIHNIIAAVKKAPKDYGELANDLKILRGLVLNCREHFDLKRQQKPTRKPVWIDSANDILKTIRDTLNDLEKRININPSENASIRRKLSWVLKQDDIQNIRSRLNQQINYLLVCMLGQSELGMKVDDFNDITTTQVYSQSRRKSQFESKGKEKAPQSCCFEIPSPNVAGPVNGQAHQAAAAERSEDINITKSVDDITELQGLLEKRTKIVDRILEKQGVRLNGLRSILANDQPVLTGKFPELKKHFSDWKIDDSQHYKAFDWDNPPRSRRHWIQRGIWWLLKSKKIFGIFSDISDRPINCTQVQAYIDLWKSFYIVWYIIPGLTEPNGENTTGETDLDCLTAEDQEEINQLSQEIYELHKELKHTSYFSNLSSSMSEVEKDGYETKYHVKLFEPIYHAPTETMETPTETELSLGSSRWLLIVNAKEHSGEPVESEVLFRTFVSASFRRAFDQDPKTASYNYILAVWVEEGSFMPRLSIYNQCGSSNLTQEVNPQTLLKPWTKPRERTEDPLKRRLYFGEETANIIFLDKLESTKLEEILKRCHLEDVLTRYNFHNDREKEIFCRSVKLSNYQRLSNLRSQLPKSLEYPHLASSTKDPPMPQLPFACRLRVTETTGKDGWDIVRRVTLTGIARPAKTELDDACLHLWCLNYFMPPSRVALKIYNHGLQVKARWCDCSHARALTHPSLFPYDYDREYECVQFEFQFERKEDSEGLEKAILQLNTPQKPTGCVSNTGNRTYIPWQSARPRQNSGTTTTSTISSWIPPTQIYEASRTPSSTRSSISTGRTTLKEEIYGPKIYQLQKNDGHKSWYSHSQSLLLTKMTKDGFKYTDLFLISKNFDISCKYSSKPCTILLRGLFYVNYGCTHHGEQPNTLEKTCFQKIPCKEEIDLRFETVSQAKYFYEWVCKPFKETWMIMHWWKDCKLEYRIPRINLQNPLSIIRYSTKNPERKKKAEITFWIKIKDGDQEIPQPQTLRMLARWDNENINHWLTADVPWFDHDSIEDCLEVSKVSRGNSIEKATMEARSMKDSSTPVENTMGAFRIDVQRPPNSQVYAVEKQIASWEARNNQVDGISNSSTRIRRVSSSTDIPSPKNIYDSRTI